VQWFRGGLVLRLIDCVYHSTLGLRVIKKKKKKKCWRGLAAQRRTGKSRKREDMPSLPGKETRLGALIGSEAEKLISHKVF